MLLKKTMSVCPEDLRPLEAELWEIDGRVIMKKTCPEHGSFEDLYWSDYGEYERAGRCRDDGAGMTRPRRTRLDCPQGCGICQRHTTRTTLMILDLTNRCNLKCPICFAAAQTGDRVYEPTVDQLRGIVEYAQRANEPNILQGILNSGGEPTVREDLLDILKMERDLGVDYLVVATNGLRLAADIEYFKALRDLEVYIYLQFDGVTPGPYQQARGRDLWPVKQRVIDNARKIGYDKVILVATIVKGVNDHQVGDMLRFVAANSDVIRHIVYQPVSFSGRIDRTRLKEMRITTPDVMRLFEEQTNGEIRKSDFFTLTMTETLAKMVTRGGRHREFCIHPHCGMVALVSLEKGRLVPISRFIDNDRFYSRMRRSFESGKSRSGIMRDLVAGFVLHVRPGFWLRLLPLLRTWTRRTGRALMDDWMRQNWVSIGIMQFMDPYNFDVDRVQRCCLHYGVPDRATGARLIPFCAMNNFHRQAVESEFSTNARAGTAPAAEASDPRRPTAVK